MWRLAFKLFFMPCLMMMLAACNAAPTEQPASPVPTSTVYTRPTLPPIPTATIDLTAASVTATPTVTLLDPLIDLEIVPPLEIDLPDSWGSTYRTLVSNEIADVGMLPFALYGGPVTGGTARIVLLWGFASIASGNSTETSIWADGLRLLRQHIVEPQCNIGTDTERNYTVGGMPALGTVYSAVDCPEDLPDTRGWFAGLNVEGVNFMFYVYTEPMTAIPGPAEDEIQAILDSVTFHIEDTANAIAVPTFTIEATTAGEAPTTGEAITETTVEATTDAGE
ncbi:hypothetical protein G4Y79_07900 [Phototrophicus methaneseepsis]|uniref:Uncharacterized protein n=1 Tax=Phototrophicus methaneseepsis TaxID=2710758 RepID=A0A7S8IF28_9CHLR|nr:hypothetical protein [Phototrophicus methaneseepsis]QPC84285.1 hypothetical protein G4Y79_07900 [Phototrophicus methaneseepsis]